MAENKLVPLGAIAADVLSALHVPGGSTFQALVAAHVKRKQTEATEILIEELKNGWHGEINFDDHDIDPFIEISFRFAKAIADGAARENLRLLAQVIAGLKKGNKILEPDKFRRWCGILEQLTRDELNLIGIAYRARRANPSRTDPDAFSQDMRGELIARGYNNAEIDALCASLVRTGLFATMSAWGGMGYIDTPWLEQLGQLANIEDIETEKG
jgi:hypothetical protein